MKRSKKKKSSQEKSHRDARDEVALKFCRECVDTVQAAHGLTDYIVMVRLSAVPSSVDVDNRVTVAEMDVDGEYYRATLTIYPKFVDMYVNGVTDDLWQIICHEVAHLRTYQVARLAEERYTSKETVQEEIERLTEMLGRCMYRAIKAEKNAVA